MRSSSRWVTEVSAGLLAAAQSVDAEPEKRTFVDPRTHEVIERTRLAVYGAAIVFAMGFAAVLLAILTVVWWVWSTLPTAARYVLSALILAEVFLMWPATGVLRRRRDGLWEPDTPFRRTLHQGLTFALAGLPARKAFFSIARWQHRRRQARNSA